MLYIFNIHIVFKEAILLQTFSIYRFVHTNTITNTIVTSLSPDVITLIGVRNVLYVPQKQNGIQLITVLTNKHIHTNNNVWLESSS